MSDNLNLKAPELTGGSDTLRLVDEEEVYRSFGGCLPVAHHNRKPASLKQRGDSLNKSCGGDDH
ncbi:hypothetical protein CR205_18770 [Alteribacter lacisalsi]|jgi:hypothetical protein|uniref:Uncharacterized protein n=1 Tax=Alteribacter lacisalsi TaxID=2045244 RepID=A0A2W0HF74_9BACI|nr:hypothetical protein CR205_18770 [Alteribacter lacisalsi]